MSKPVSKTMIGAFVVGALALACLAVAVFGSGKLFSQSYRLVLFFDTSVSGLNTGSPVVIQGVRVGRVDSIHLISNVKDMNYRIPVFIELDKNKLGTPLTADIDAPDKKAYLDRLISRGFRGRLVQQSLLTGQLMIELNIFPPSELGEELHEVTFYEDCPVIPTISSRIDTMMHKLIHLPIDEIAENLLHITDSLSQAMTPESMKELFAKIDKTAENTLALSESLSAALSKESTAALTARLDALLAQAQEMFASAGKLTRRSDARLDTLAKDLAAAITDFRKIANPTSLQMLELNHALREISEAARAVRQLANMLNSTPEALLRGKNNIEASTGPGVK